MKKHAIFAALLLCAITTPLLFTSCSNVTNILSGGKTYTISIGSGIQHGLISADKESFKYNETVTLTIRPDQGYELSFITAAAGDTTLTLRGTGNIRTFTMPAGNVTVNAAFQQTSYSVTVSTSISNGSVSADKEEAHYGDTVYLTASPADRYEFEAWNVRDEDGRPITVSSSNSFTMPASDVTVSATFTELPPEVYSIYVNGGRAYIGEEIVSSATAGTSVRIEANSLSEGYEFDRWQTDSNISIDSLNSSTTYFTMPEASVSIRATSKYKTYSISRGVITNGNISVAASAAYNSDVTITLTPNTGYKIDSLVYINSSGGQNNIGGNGNTRTFRMPASNVSINATFVPIDYTISTTGSIANGSISADRTRAHYGDTVALSAAPNTGYQLGSWDVRDDNGHTITVTNNTFTMPAVNVTVNANFMPRNYSISTGQITNGTITVASNANYGSTVTISATFRFGYVFPTISVKKGSDDVPISEDNSEWTFTMPAGDVTISATFNLGSKLHPDSVGDIVFNDGSAVPYDANLNSTQKANAIAVIYSTANNKILGLGLKQRQAELCTKTAQGFNSTICTAQAVGDGKSNQDKIKAFSDYNEQNYPAFWWAEHYSGNGNLEGYAEGWVIPTIRDLEKINNSKSIIYTALNKIGSQFADSLNDGEEINLRNCYFSSTQNGGENNKTSVLIYCFIVGNMTAATKENRCSNLVVRQFQYN